MMSEKFIEEVLTRHKYNVNIYGFKREDKYCIASDYPDPYNDYLQYTLDPKDFKLEIKYKDSIELICLPKHCLRLYVLLDILHNIKIRKLPKYIIRLYKENKRVNLWHDLVGDFFIDQTEDEIKNEKIFDYLCSSILEKPSRVNEFDEELKKQGLYTSFNLLKGLLV